MLLFVVCFCCVLLLFVIRCCLSFGVVVCCLLFVGCGVLSLLVAAVPWCSLVLLSLCVVVAACRCLMFAVDSGCCIRFFFVAVVV